MEMGVWEEFCINVELKNEILQDSRRKSNCHSTLGYGETRGLSLWKESVSEYFFLEVEIEVVTASFLKQDAGKHVGDV